MLVAADREEVKEVTVAAGVKRSAPVATDISFPPGEVVYLEVRIPLGAAGLAGFQLTNSGQQALPYNTGAFFIGDNEVIQRDVVGYNNSGRWGFRAYNEDVNPHTFQIRFSVIEISKVVGPAAPGVPLPVSPTGQVETPGTPTTPEGEATPPVSEPEPGAPPTEGEVTPPGETPPPPVGEPAPPPPIGGTEEEPAPPPSAGPPTFPAGEEEPAPPPGVGPGEPGLPSVEPGAEPGEQPEVISQSAQPTSPGVKSKTHTQVVTKVIEEHLPAGGWLPHGARFTREQTDQGQDGITNWKGRIIAPGDGYVIHNLSDKPFPDGFGPRYAVVHIDTGPFAGHDWYVGHCTSAVNAGHHFKQGDTLAHADQGNREGGGWFEIGEAPGGVPGPMGNGANWAHLFETVTRRRVEKHTLKVKGGKPSPKRKPAAKGHGKPKGKLTHPARPHGKPAPKRAGAHGPAKAPAKRHPGTPTAHHASAPARHAPAPVAHHPAARAPARPAPKPAARRPAPPPPPPPARRPPPPPPRRRK